MPNLKIKLRPGMVINRTGNPDRIFVLQEQEVDVIHVEGSVAYIALPNTTGEYYVSTVYMNTGEV